ncbi:hypothetical protein [Oceanidesulfovibrio marinus]|uniref:Uncharacterized protein n=1 Tax=Oceanidesulfovibrio marinus TaxID=370038 RepID=A0A6P1ZHY0_9BACT|nr:hypothetical protein [Oceanidesulfovibrio marinus]TVM34634.1 hypothetical protein DQK91_08665 [Oceanidesulfovibrio marinus]
MSAKYRSGFEYFTEVFSKEYKVDKSILAGAAREVWENELTDEDRASWEEMARFSEQEESAKAAEKKAEPKAEPKKEEPKPAEKKVEDKKPEPKVEAKKADDKKAEAKSDEKKEAPKADAKKDDKKDVAKAEEDKAAEKKSEAKAEEKKPESKAEPKKEEPKAEAKPNAKKDEPKPETKPDEKKVEDKKPEPKAEAKKSDEKKAEAKPEVIVDAKPEAIVEAKPDAKKEEPKAETKKDEAKADEDKSAAKSKAEEKKEEPKAAEKKTAAEAAKEAPSSPGLPAFVKAEQPDFEAARTSFSTPAASEKPGAAESSDASKQPPMVVPPAKDPIGTAFESLLEQKQADPAPTPPSTPPSAPPNMDLDKLKQAIGKRVSSKEEELAAQFAPQQTEPEPQPGGYRDTLSSSGFFTSSGPIKSGLTISASADEPRRTAAKEASVEHVTSEGHTAAESIPEIQDPSAVTLDAPSAAVMRRKLMEKADELADAVVSKALDGDVQALALCIERVLAPVDEARLHIDLPPLDTHENILQASESVVRAVSLGELDPNQAKTLHALIEAHWRILEGSELANRLSVLEQRGGVGKRQKITLGAFDKPF